MQRRRRKNPVDGTRPWPSDELSTPTHIVLQQLRAITVRRNKKKKTMGDQHKTYRRAGQHAELEKKRKRQNSGRAPKICDDIHSWVNICQHELEEKQESRMPRLSKSFVTSNVLP